MRTKKVFIISCLCFFILGCSSPVEQIYYIPQAKMYAKTVYKRGDKSGYIMFTNDSSMNLSKNVDYVKSSSQLSAIFLLNTVNGNDIGIYYNGNILEINPVKYRFIENITETDSLYYGKRNRTNPLIVKVPYIEFVVTDYFRRALIKKPGEESYTEIKPVK